MISLCMLPFEFFFILMHFMCSNLQFANCNCFIQTHADSLHSVERLARCSTRKLMYNGGKEEGRGEERKEGFLRGRV